MLKNIDYRVTPELLYALARLGHGDEIALVDSNFPAYSTAADRSVIELPGMDAPIATAVLLKLIPLDVADEPCFRMLVAGDPERWEPVHREVQNVLDAQADGPCHLKGVERPNFYERAAKSSLVIRSGERRLYGCFLFRLGVVPPG